MISDESILHYLWKHKMFSTKALWVANSEEPIEIIASGYHNYNAGPDFYESKLKIGETLWAGSVEIHINSSDWAKHRHQTDRAYDNVILHVVWNNDKEVFRTDGTLIPVLELKNRVDLKLIDKIIKIKNNDYWIPCQQDIHKIDDFTYKNWIDRILVERLDYKIEYIQQLYDASKGSWEDTFYILLAGNFGFKVNREPFEMLAKNLPQRLLALHKDNRKQIEALIFGVAGFLNEDFKDDYPKALKKEFEFLKHKYELHSLEKFVWKFAKTRPDNFPTIRLAQFAALVHKSSHLFSKLLVEQDLPAYKILFSELSINDYWFEHHHFDKSRKKNAAIRIGEKSIDNILVNSVAPMLFFYGNFLGKQKFKDKALYILENLKAEENKNVDGFKKLGFNIHSAYQSQGLIHLKNFYCNQKKCLNCAFGMKILKT